MTDETRERIAADIAARQQRRAQIHALMAALHNEDQQHLGAIDALGALLADEEEGEG